MRKILSGMLMLFGFAAFADLTLESGPYKVVLSEKEHFSIAQVWFGGYEIGTRTGYYGTILAPDPNKFIGSGHTEGGAEQLQSLSVEADGKQIEERNGVFSGNLIKFTKITRLGNLLVTIDTVITPEEIRIDKKWVAEAEQKIHSFYIFQYCWNAKTDSWIVGYDEPDKFKTGTFADNEKFILSSEADVLWCAVYSTADKKGVMTFFNKYFANQGVCLLWDRQYYHKFYFWPKYPAVVPRGYQSPEYSIIIKGLGESSDWMKEARSQALVFEKKYPRFAGASEFSYAGNDTGHEVKGNGAFKCDKVPLILEKNASYEISFKIKKSENNTAVLTNANLTIGQHDKARKFYFYAAFGGQVPNDGEWHEIRGTFKSPDFMHDFNLFLYNINSQGSVAFKDIKIKKTE